MPRKHDQNASRVVYRTARCGLRVTPHQRERVFGLLRSAGDVWCAVLELNAWRRRRQDPPLAGYAELYRELARSGPGTFGELDSTGARSVLRRYSDAWFATAKRRKQGDTSARYPRRKRGLVPVRWYHGKFRLDGRLLTIPVARGCPPLTVRLDRDVPYPAGQVRSVTLGYNAGRLYADVTAEVPVAFYPPGQRPHPDRTAGIDLGIIHPYAAAGPEGQGLLVSGRAIRAECRQHLRDRKGRARAAAARAPKPGQRGSRRWRQHRRSERKAEARHDRRVRQAQHEAAKQVITWALAHGIGALVIGDPRGVLDLKAGRRHNQRTRDWRVGHLIRILSNKAEAAGISVHLADERGTSSTCPNCARRVPKPTGRNFSCPHCGQAGHRDLVAAASIAARGPGGGIIPVVPAGAGITHRRTGAHLPGVHPARRDPRRRPPSRPAPRRHLAGTGPPRIPPGNGGKTGSRSRQREEPANTPGTPPDEHAGRRTSLACGGPESPSRARHGDGGPAETTIRRKRMAQTQLGGTFTLAMDLTVHRMGYGAMQLAGPGVFGPPADRDAAVAVLRAAADLGVDHIDTSDYYGPYVTNEIIREALYPYPADLHIVTKVGALRDAQGGWPAARAPHQLRQAVHDNLDRLGLDALDVVNLRLGGYGGPEPGSVAEPFGTLAELQKEGLIRHLGVSNVSPEQFAEAQSIAPVVCVQNAYNIAHRGDDAFIDALSDQGVAYTPFFPLGGFTQLQAAELDAVAARLGSTPLAVALAWLLHRSPNILLIPGTSSVAHLRENVAAAALDLPADALAELDSIAAALRLPRLDPGE